jgi:hydroxyacid-oxoacid transhydrogenase
VLEQLLHDGLLVGADIPAFVEGALPQHRVTRLSPRPAGPEELAELFRNSRTIW